MKLGEELASGNDKAAIGKINQLYNSAISKYGQTQDAINHFLKFLYLYETQGDSLCGGLKMLDGIRKIIRKDFIIKTTGESINYASRYSNLSAEEWSYVLGYALRYAEVRSKLIRKDNEYMPKYNKTEKTQKNMISDNASNNKKYEHHTNLKRKDNKKTVYNNGANQSINNSMAEQILKWKNDQ